MQKELKIKGLIVRTVDIGEADRMLTVLTADYGRISIYARGVRSIKSHRLGSTQLFCFSEMSLTLRGDRYTLGEVTPIEDFYQLREDIVRLALAGYIADAVSVLTIEGDDQSDILRLTLNTLYLLASGSKPLPLVKGAFELRLASLLGFMPDLSVCSVCSSENATYLVPSDGVLICGECLIKHNALSPNEQINAISLTKSILYAMRYVLTAPDKRVFAFSIEEKEQEQFSDICEKYLLCHIDRGFDTLEFYKIISD